MYGDVNYGDIEDLEKQLLYKRIVKWDKDELVLHTGTVITLETSELDCCAGAYGEFSDVKLDAVITNVEIGKEVDIPDDDTRVSKVKVTVYHNQNPIALAEMRADAGNGGYYYSVGSMVVDKIHYPIVRA